jgi:hypothetical protein
MSDRSVEYQAVFHASLMGLFKDYTIQGRTLFPGARFVEMASKLRRAEASDTIQLRNVSVLEPLDLSTGPKLVCHVDRVTGRIEFRATEESRVFCSVAETRKLPKLAAGDVLSFVRARCTQEVLGLAERYRALQTKVSTVLSSRRWTACGLEKTNP